MKKKKKEYTGMPLSLWGISVITALGILSLLYVFFSISEIEPNKNRTKLLREKTYIYDTNSRLDAYFLGSSLTRGALLAFNSLENSIKKSNKEFNFKLVVGNGFSLNDFNYKIKEIKILQPKCLFIERNLISTDNFENPVLSFRHRLARIPVDFFNLRNLFKVNNNPASDNLIEQFDPDFIIDKNNKMPKVKIRIRGINEFLLWKEFFKVAEKHGIKIYLVEVPISNEADLQLSNSLKQQIKLLITRYYEDYSISYVGFSEKLTRDKYYLDGAHFNKPGADYYADWLVNEIFNRKLLK
jgi:hypothetical protein